MDNQRNLIINNLEVERLLLSLYLKMNSKDFFVYLNDNLQKNPYFENILLNQLKRVNYWIFADNKNDLNFKKLLKNFNY